MAGQEAALKQQAVHFDRLIHQQAGALLERHCAGRVPALTRALAAFGIAAPPVVRFVEVWEDYEKGLLPPKVVGELLVPCNAGTIAFRFDVPVGAFHDNRKSDQIFELCMLRAEAHQELQGGGDGHVLDRMRELRGMIESGEVTFE